MTTQTEKLLAIVESAISDMDIEKLAFLEEHFGRLRLQSEQVEKILDTK
jgi:hypothetical protein